MIKRIMIKISFIIRFMIIAIIPAYFIADLRIIIVAEVGLAVISICYFAYFYLFYFFKKYI